MTPHEFMITHTDYTVASYKTPDHMQHISGKYVEALFAIPLEDIPRILVRANDPECQDLHKLIGLPGYEYLNPLHSSRFVRLLEKRMEVGV